MLYDFYYPHGYRDNNKFVTYSQQKCLKYHPHSLIQPVLNEAESFFGNKFPDETPIYWPLSNECDCEGGGHKEEKNYLTFEALEDTKFTFSNNALQYSLDGGETWDTLPSYTKSPTISTGSKIMWKQTGLVPRSFEGIGTFTATGRFKVSGNIMSLLFGDDFEGQTDLTMMDYAFMNLFSMNYKIVDSSSLLLPATTLAPYCYSRMFLGCGSLALPPKLPATTLAEGCYEMMFNSCTSMPQAPELPATQLANRCYFSMFRLCKSFTTAPALPATTMANECYNEMFFDCTSLTSAPELPATTLAQSCYNSMFNGCTSLTSAPELPATTLANMCYMYMFSNCTSLTSPPELPSTALAERCYQGMFNNCTSLATAPELPATTLFYLCYSQMFLACVLLTEAPELQATTLVDSCYMLMFHGCTSLNYVKCLATDISALGCVNGWLKDVSDSGTFVKAASMSSWTRDEHGIPRDWTVEDA